VRSKRFAVVGDPVAHSKSPAMHGAAFRALGLPHTYEAVRFTADELPQAVAMLREGTFDGLNVTVPHKERVLSLADHLDASARVAGAANTLVRDADGRVVAYNTDAPALAAELRRLLGPVPLPGGFRALVLGSGGASRAAIAALGVNLGFADVVVRARAFAENGRKEAFAASAPCPVTPQPWCASPGSEARTLAIVQATSAGMQGADAGEAVTAVVAWDALPTGAVAIDVVYAPPSTPWLRAARARGLRCDNGLGMLARQGALALELWLGIEAPLEVMRAAIE
jgi:shikimate dehydrogenase